MKRSIIAVAALLLLAASTTYATPPRAPRRPRFWGSVLCWFGFGHHGPHRMARPHEHGHHPPAFAPEQLPPGHRGRPYHGRGRHRGWERGRHNGWDRDDGHHGGRPGPDRPREGERGGYSGHGRGRG